MNVLISAWERCDLEKVKEVLETLNHSAVLYFEKPRNVSQDPRFRSILRRFVKEMHVDVVLSINYYPILSRVCQETDIAYLCWCPTLSPENIPGKLLDYNKNFYFLFDRQAVNNLQQIGITNVFYLPYALDFPEQIEAYKDITGIDNTAASSYMDGYLNGLLQIKKCMKRYEESLPADIFLDYQNDFLSMHSLKIRLQNVIKLVIR